MNGFRQESGLLLVICKVYLMGEGKEVRRGSVIKATYVARAQEVTNMLW